MLSIGGQKEFLGVGRINSLSAERVIPVREHSWPGFGSHTYIAVARQFYDSLRSCGVVEGAKDAKVEALLKKLDAIRS